MWDQLERMMMGSKVGNQLKGSICLNNYEEFKAKENESLEATYDRFITLLNELSKNRVNKSQIELNNEEEVNEIRSDKKKVEKPVVDPIALVVNRKEKKYVSLKKKKVIVSESEEENTDESESDDGENQKQAMFLLTRAFQKKSYKKPGSNSQRNPKVKNSIITRTRCSWKKQKEAGKALMAEDDYWLDHTDYEDE
ncbi:hypothetical protein L6452_02136 [Arctium lappa]|uniref:Uncharacterized protein n=1 Tax=Arctium lappa TaxID=4217 RepID=A0ACB9FIJ2_ARCLA|nr:hypothetical protein L6452_02136 [Arctium lappa]